MWKHVLAAVDFMELLNKTAGDLSAARGLQLTDLYNIATQNQSVFIEEYVLKHILIIFIRQKLVEEVNKRKNKTKQNNKVN